MAALNYDKKRERWVIRYYDNDGIQRWETLEKGTSARNANRRKREIEDSLDKKIFRPNSEIPLFKEVAQRWLDLKSEKIRKSTKLQYEGHINNHIKLYFGEMKTNEIDLDITEEFVFKLNKKGISGNTIRKIVTTLGAIMKYASHPRRCYASFNPVEYIENLPKFQKREAVFASYEEIIAMQNQMQNRRDKLIIFTAAMTGMREGELFGLKWKDLMWDDSQIFVRRTFNHGEFHDPKTECSKRKIDIPDDLMHELKKWKLACPNKGELDLVFPNKEGNPEDATNWIRRIWHPARVKAEVKYLTPHSLRHFYASYLLSQGEDVNYVKRVLGHERVEITINLYGHLLNKCNKRAAEKIGKLFFKPDVCKTSAKTQKIKKGDRSK